MTMITLLNGFTFAGASGQGFVSDWVRIPEENQNWQVNFLIHGFVSGSTGTVRLTTSWDTGVTSNPGASVALTNLGLNVQDISTGMGPLIRVTIASSANSIVTMSVFLTPKNE